MKIKNSGDLSNTIMCLMSDVDTTNAIGQLTQNQLDSCDITLDGCTYTLVYDAGVIHITTVGEVNNDVVCAINLITQCDLSLNGEAVKLDISLWKMAIKPVGYTLGFAALGIMGYMAYRKYVS